VNEAKHYKNGEMAEKAKQGRDLEKLNGTGQDSKNHQLLKFAHSS
jgi:hypothetical protein